MLDMSHSISASQICLARKVGFAGLGAMGFGMASNLLKAGFDVHGLDPGDSARERFEKAGGRATTSIEKSCKDCSHYVIMVATPAQVDGLIFGGDGLIQHLPQGSIVCLCCTLPPTYVRKLPARLSASGRQEIRIIDSPVSGGVSGAVNGTLNIMIAGDPLAIEEIEPLLQAMAAPGRLFRCGQLSNASTLKMLNQHLAGIHIVSAAEILAFAKALQLSTRETYDIVTRGTSASWIFGDRGTHMLDGDWTTRSAIDIFVKDLGIVNNSADNICFPCPMASQAYYQFLLSSSRGYGRQDDSIVVRNYEAAAGDVAEIPVETTAQSVCEGETVWPAFTTVLNPSAVGSLSFLERRLIKSLEKQPSIKKVQQVYLHLDQRDEKQSYECETKQVCLYICHQKECGMATLQLAAVADGSIIAVFGLRDSQEAQSFFQQVAPKYPRLTFTDCQVLPGNEANSPKILFSATTDEVVKHVRTALLPYAPTGCHPVSAKFSSATSMYLVLRLGAIIHVAAAAECHALTRAMGVAPELLYKLVAGAAGSSAQFNKYFPHMMRTEWSLHSNGGSDDTCDDSLDQSLEDLVRLAPFHLHVEPRIFTYGMADNHMKAILQSTARRLKFPAVLLNTAHQLFKAARSKNKGQLSITALRQCWTACEQEEIHRERRNHI